MDVDDNERTGLIRQGSSHAGSLDREKSSSSSSRRRRFLVVGLVALTAAVVASFTVVDWRSSRRSSADAFGEEFVWGVATSSYQVEGAVAEDGRGESIWDTFTEVEGNIIDGSSGAVACDNYHLFESDIQLMKELGIKAYRFSIAWPRILPHGTGEVNPKGVAFYGRLIDTLIENGIVPWVTLYHWDLPQSLEDEYGGWLDKQIVGDFGDYARVCFQVFGDRVKHWITLNESWTVAVQSYIDGAKAPGRNDQVPFATYIAGHHLILAHAATVQIYREEFLESQGGVIGIANCGDFRYPASDSIADSEAAERAMVFQFAWFTDPFYFGDYPKEMKDILGNRLLEFSTTEKEMLLAGMPDFIGLNHYSSLLAGLPKEKPTFEGYWADMNVEFSAKPDWGTNNMGWSIVPSGCRDFLLWMAKRYDDPTIVITESGTAEKGEEIVITPELVIDVARKEYYESYLKAALEATFLGVKLKGYFAWSLMDNFEWEHGYQERFGMIHVNFTTLARTLKYSAVWYAGTIKANGRNLLE